MEKIIEGHLVGFGSVRDMERLEEYWDEDFTDAGMTEIRRKVDVPGREECDWMCKENSSKVKTI